MTCIDEMIALVHELSRERVAIAIRLHPDTIRALIYEAADYLPRITLAAATDQSFYGIPLIADSTVPVGDHRIDYADGRP